MRQAARAAIVRPDKVAQQASTSRTRSHSRRDYKRKRQTVADDFLSSDYSYDNTQEAETNDEDGPTHAQFLTVLGVAKKERDDGAACMQDLVPASEVLVMAEPLQLAANDPKPGEFDDLTGVQVVNMV